MLLRNSAMRPERSLSMPSAPGHTMYLITCRGAVLRRMRRMSASVTPNPRKPCPTRIPPEEQGYGTVAQCIPSRADVSHRRARR